MSPVLYFKPQNSEKSKIVAVNQVNSTQVLVSGTVIRAEFSETTALSSVYEQLQFVG